MLGTDMMGANKLVNGIAATLGNTTQGSGTRGALGPYQPTQEIHH